MKFKSLSNNEININISRNKFAIKSEEDCKSKFQYSLGKVLVDLYPNYSILEEFYIPIEKLYLDFLIPQLLLAFEAQGDQHNEFIPHFHKYYHNFASSQHRD